MTERRRIAREIALIRVALKKCGHSIHKRARQAIWKVYITNDRFYTLTFQPAPISSWVLHPHDNSPDRCAIETIIGRALEKQPQPLSEEYHDLQKTTSTLVYCPPTSQLAADCCRSISSPQ